MTIRHLGATMDRLYDQWGPKTDDSAERLQEKILKLEKQQWGKTDWLRVELIEDCYDAIDDLFRSSENWNLWVQT